MTVVTIDGPAGAGKSTVAREVADRLGWTYVDTGAMYRAVALSALRRGISPRDGEAVANVARSADIRLANEKVFLDGRDVTSEIRGDDVTEAVSEVSAHPEVRAALIALQRSSADGADVVMEGRDIGSAVFPDAEVKVWLTASAGERAKRRLRQLGRSTEGASLSEMERALAERDRIDASRSASPMRRPAGAIEIDTTHKGIAEVSEEIVRVARRRNDNG